MSLCLHKKETVFCFYFLKDEQIRTHIEKILKTADLELVTMKTVRQQIIAMYPNHDLAEKKDFIKATVKEVTLLFIHVSQLFWPQSGPV